MAGYINGALYSLLLALLLWEPVRMIRDKRKSRKRVRL
jgi:hypothetical protein